jgi:hypothetical protein
MRDVQEWEGEMGWKTPGGFEERRRYDSGQKRFEATQKI